MIHVIHCPSGTATIGVTQMASLIGDPRESVKDKVKWFETFADKLKDKIFEMCSTSHIFIVLTPSTFRSQAVGS